MDLDFLLAHSHGVVRTAQLQACDLTAADIRTATRSGKLSALRHGWYAAPNADPTVVRAVRAGGVLTCLSALDVHGYWTPPLSALHIRRTEHGKYRAASARSGTDIHECSVRRDNPSPVGSVDGSLSALRSMPGCVTQEELVAVVDSMLHKRRVAINDIRDALSGHPRHIRDLLRRCDHRAESGTESLVRLRLRRLHVKVTPPVQIPGVGRVDLLVGNRLVIEIDSWKHHSAYEAYENDRARDLALNELDYLVIRPTYRRVMFDWPSAERAIMAIVGRGDHLRGGRRH